jgi:hypothetical protein
LSVFSFFRFFRFPTVDSSALFLFSSLLGVLAPGVGYNRTIFVSAQGEVSLPHDKLSYSAPFISRVIGCRSPNANGQGVLGCHRNGTSVVQIFGSNFGPRPAKVLVCLFLPCFVVVLVVFFLMVLMVICVCRSVLGAVRMFKSIPPTLIPSSTVLCLPAILQKLLCF